MRGMSGADRALQADFDAVHIKSSVTKSELPILNREPIQGRMVIFGIL